MRISDWSADVCSSDLPFFLAQAAAPHLAAARGAIVNMTDIHAQRPLRDHAVYCMAKAALEMATKSLALEMAPRVRVNAIAPRSEERRGGKECVSTWRARWSPDP